MRGLYRPVNPASKRTLAKGERCKSKAHGMGDTCPACGAEFLSVWWARYSVNGRFIRESTGCHTKKEAQRFLDNRRGSAVKGEVVLPSVDRIRYEEVAEDLRLDYATYETRDLKEVGYRLAHLAKFFGGRTVVSIGEREINLYITARKKEHASNGTINRDLAVLGKMLRLAYKHKKLMHLPDIQHLKEAKPRKGFLLPHQFAAVKPHLRTDLQVACAIAYTWGFRMQSEVLKLTLDQVDLGACTLRLEPGTTKNEDARNVFMTPALRDEVQAQVDRVELLSVTLGRKIPCLFPYLDGKRKGERIKDFRKAWVTACREGQLDLEGVKGEERTQRKAEMRATPKEGLQGALRHDMRRSSVRNMVRAGVSEKVAMTLSGHRTRSVFDRYNIGNEADKQEAAKLVALYLQHSNCTVEGKPEEVNNSTT